MFRAAEPLFDNRAAFEDYKARVQQMTRPGSPAADTSLQADEKLRKQQIDEQNTRMTKKLFDEIQDQGKGEKILKIKLDSISSP